MSVLRSSGKTQLHRKQCLRPFRIPSDLRVGGLRLIEVGIIISSEDPADTRTR